MRVILLVFFLLSTQLLPAQTDSSRYEISLLTCAPGNALYSTFGHSAIHIVDKMGSKSGVYNYGIFDFDTPNFYLKFVRGKLDYKLGKQKYKRFLREYQYYERDVIANKFILSDVEAERIIKLLEENYKPENRYYAYDFFYDNCSSRIRDIYEQMSGAQVVPNTDFDSGKTYRNLLDEYLKDKPWSDFGIDLILGQPADALTDFRSQMYLPDYLMANLKAGKSPSNNPILGPNNPVYIFPNVKPRPGLLTLPVFWASILFVLITLFSFWKKESLGLRLFDGLLISITGLAGCLFLFMWLGTDHQACFANWNMLWLFPLNLFFGWKLFKKELTPFSRNYFSFVALLIAIALLGWLVIPQQFHIAFLPLMLVLLLRLVFRVMGTK